jgi:hypothetical protein
MATGTIAMAAGAFVRAIRRHQQRCLLHRGTAAVVVEGRWQESVISCSLTLTVFFMRIRACNPFTMQLLCRGMKYAEKQWVLDPSLTSLFHEGAAL